MGAWRRLRNRRVRPRPYVDPALRVAAARIRDEIRGRAFTEHLRSLTDNDLLTDSTTAAAEAPATAVTTPNT